jgi:hypothetical protein
MWKMLLFGFSRSSYQMAWYVPVSSASTHGSTWYVFATPGGASICDADHTVPFDVPRE